MQIRRLAVAFDRRPEYIYTFSVMAKKKKRSRIDWLNHFLSLLGVVLGVLIAFWLNSWAQSRKEDKIVLTALKNIRNELVKNSVRVDSTVAAHTELYEFLGQYLQYVNEDMSLKGGYDKVDSLMAVYPQYLKQRSSIFVQTKIYQLSDVAWRTAVGTGAASNLDYELAYQLQTIYDFQEKVKMLDENIIADMKAIAGRREAFDNLRRSMMMSQILASNLKDSSFYLASIRAIDALIGNGKPALLSAGR